MQLYNDATSPFGRKILVAAAERAIALDEVIIDVYSPGPLDDHNPLRQTPTLVTDEGEALYARLLTVGWKRTPDPRNATNGPALRFRLDETECLFSVYSGMMVGTQAEMRVSAAFKVRPGEERYNLLVQCVSATQAVP